MTDLQQEIRNHIKYYQSHALTEWKNADKKRQRKYNLWYERAHKHFDATILPRIRERQEKLIDVYPAQFFWSGGSEYKQGAFDNRPFVYKNGSFGTGYLAQTDRSLYIVSLRELTEKYPLYPSAFSTEGFLDTLFSSMAGERDNRRPVRKDLEEVIPLSTIIGAKMASGDIRTTPHIYTRASSIQVYPHFGDADELILTGIHMFMAGTKSPSSDTGNTSKSDELVKLLKQLQELRAAGVLSEEEFSAKKEDLLSRL